MIREKLNGLIMEAMKNGDDVRKECLRSIKTAIMNWQTAKENVGKEYTDSVEIGVLRKLVAQYKDTAGQCNDGKHDDIVKSATESAKIIETEFLPAPVSRETIRKAVVDLSGEMELNKQNMGRFIKTIKTRFPSADGKMVSEVVMSFF